MKTRRLNHLVRGRYRARNPFPLWRASSLALPPGFTFTRSGNGVVFEGSTFAGRLVVTKGTDVPRFEALSGDRQGLLIEGARTNLLLRSSTFDNASWSAVRTAVTPDIVVGPGGSATGDAMIEDTSVTTTHRISQAVTLAANTVSCLSVWAKRVVGTRNLKLSLGAGADEFLAYFDFDTLAVTTATAGTGSVSGSGMIAYPNGWYRCWVAGIHSTATANPTAYINSASGTNQSYTGDGVSSLGLWNAQLETAAFPGAAISTSAATVTRNAETCSRSVTLPSGGFTVVYEVFTAPAPDASLTQAIAGFDDGSGANRIQIRRAASTGDLVAFGVASSVGIVNSTVGAMANSTRHKIAMRVQNDNFGISLNGAAVVADTFCTFNFSGMTTEHLGVNHASSEPLHGHIIACNASSTVWRPPVSDAELRALSTLA